MLRRRLNPCFAAFIIMLGNFGCRGDDCPGPPRCNGDVLETCEESSGGVYLTTRSCQPGACIAPTGVNPFCALDKKPDARCPTSATAVCDAARLVTCRDGYATAAFDCAAGESWDGEVVLAEGTSGACVEVTDGAQCVAEADRNPDCPSDRDYFSGCSGNDQVDCRYGYVIRRTSCGAAFCRRGLTAVCSLTEEPDLECSQSDRVSSFCEEQTLVTCGWDYRVSEQPCSADEVCAPFSVGNAVCEPRP